MGCAIGQGASADLAPRDSGVTGSKARGAIPELTEEEVARFWSKVYVCGDGCWLWTKEVNNQGYGRFEIRRDGCRVRVLAHRLAYRLATGLDPGRNVVRHRCDNPLCCNPADLHAGTQVDNMRDAVARGRVNTSGLTAYRLARDARSAADIAANQRRCSVCAEVKPLDAFSRSNTSPGGRRYQCRSCINARERAKREQQNSRQTAKPVVEAEETAA